MSTSARVLLLAAALLQAMLCMVQGLGPVVYLDGAGGRPHADHAHAHDHGHDHDHPHAPVAAEVDPHHAPGLLAANAAHAHPPGTPPHVHLDALADAFTAPRLALGVVAAAPAPLPPAFSAAPDFARKGRPAARPEAHCLSPPATARSLPLLI